MQHFLKSLILKEEYIECPVAIITQSAHCFSLVVTSVQQLTLPNYYEFFKLI